MKTGEQRLGLGKGMSTDQEIRHHAFSLPSELRKLAFAVGVDLVLADAGAKEKEGAFSRHFRSCSEFLVI